MSDSFAFQISVKVGNALYNVRGQDRVEFNDNLKFAAENVKNIKAFCAEFEEAAPRPEPRFHTTGSAPAAPAAPTQWLKDEKVPYVQPGSPVKIVGIESSEGVSESSGKPWKKWSVKFSDGRKASTFDALVAAVAKTVSAEDAYCVASTKPSRNPKYLDLDAIQRSGAPA